MNQQRTEDTIIYRKIILVDSAGLGFVEIPIDHHAILLGKGNVGKSSILNAIRLFLLPENNFHKSQLKFGFRVPKKDAYYSNDEAYQHYFPSSRSFLIIEVQNYVGTHCQILHRSNNLGYGRIFTPFEFNRIRHLFWELGNDDQGIGRAVDDLSVNSLTATLKKMSSHTQIASDPSKIKKLLYGTGDFLDPEAIRYALFPLLKPDDASIESLRALVLLLFEMNAGNKTVTTAIANIMEAGKKRDEDVLDFNIDAFFTKHDELKKEEARLTRIKNAQPAFQSLKASYSRYMQLQDLEARYQSFEKAVSEAESRLANERQSNDKVYESCKETKLSAEIYRQELADKRTGLKELLRADKALQIDSTRALKTYEQIRLEFPDDISDSDILDNLIADKQDKTEDIEALLNSEKNIQRRQHLEKKLSEKRAQYESLILSKENGAFRISEQINSQVQSVLAAVNKGLILANPNRALTTNEIDKLTQFSSLFTESNETYQFFDRNFQKQNAAVDIDEQRDISELKAEIVSYEKSLKSITVENDQNPLLKKKQLQDLQKQLEKTIADLEVVQHIGFHRKQMSDVSKRVEQNTKLLQETEQDLEKANTEFNSALSKLNDAKQDSEKIKSKSSNLILIKGRLKTLSNRYPRLLEGEALTDELKDISIDMVDVFEEQLQLFDKLKIEVLSTLKEMHHERLFSFREILETPDDGTIMRAVQELSRVFDELPEHEAFLRARIHEHNESVASYTKILRDTSDYIARFENSLNRSFASVQINDLEKVEVNISVHPKFRNLIGEIVKLNIHGEQLPSEQFYDRLRVFVDEFFRDEESRLTMDKILTALSYKTQKRHESFMQAKEQSTSTTELINFQLVQVLLDRMTVNGMRVQMPLVYDEIANVNLDQFDWLLPHLEDNGFSLFSASTYSASSELIHKVGRFIEIGSTRTGRPYHQGRDIVCWNSEEGFEHAEASYLTGLELAEQTDWLEDD